MGGGGGDWYSRGTELAPYYNQVELGQELSIILSCPRH